MEQVIKTPSEVESELATLGCIFLEPSIFETVNSILQTDDFYDPKNRLIFKAMLDLFNDGQVIDPTTVTSYLEKMSILEQAGGIEYISQIAMRGYSTDNVENYADGKAEEGVQYDFKFYTAGEGNLTAEATAKFTDYIFDGIKTNGTGKVKFGWDKYLLVEEAITSELHGVDTESDTDATAKIEVNEKLAFEVKTAYPNLDEYKQVVLG